MKPTFLGPIQSMSVDEYIKVCEQYIKDNDINVKDLSKADCPIHNYAATVNKVCLDVHAGISMCPICDNGMCNICKNHNVQQISRVTGYMSVVSGFNEGKKQELRDRKRYNVSTGEII